MRKVVKRLPERRNVGTEVGGTAYFCCANTILDSYRSNRRICRAREFTLEKFTKEHENSWSGYGPKKMERSRTGERDKEGARKNNWPSIPDRELTREQS